MRCPNCGSQARGRFCTACGNPLASAPSSVDETWSSTSPGPPAAGRTIDPASTVILGPSMMQEFATSNQAVGPGVAVPVTGAPSLTFDTPNFRIHYREETFAEKHITMIGGRLENAHGTITGVLDLGVGAGRIDVYLDDIVVDPAGQRLARGGYALPERRSIHEVYRSDAPGEGLERSLLLILLAPVVDARTPPPFVVDGILAQVMQRLGGFPPDDEVAPALAGAKARGELPSITDLIGGPTSNTQAHYYPAAALSVAYIVRTYGARSFREFVRQLDPARPDAAARTAFGRSLLQIDKAWRKTLTTVQPGGILRFVRLSGTYLRPYRRQVAEVLLYLVMSVAFFIGMARMQGILLDRALIPHDLHALGVIMAILIGAFVVVSLTSLRQSYLTAYISESVLRTMRVRMFTLLQRLHPGFFQTMETGDIMSRMTNDLAEIEFALTGGLAQSLLLGLTLVAAILTIFLTNWKLAAIAMVGTPLFFVVGHYLGPAVARVSFERQKHLGDSTSTLHENLAAQPVVKAFGLEDRMVTGYRDRLDALFRSSLRLTYLSGIYGTSSNSLASGIQLLILGIGSYLVIGSSLTTGTLFAFLALMSQIIGPMQGISGILQSLQQASGAMDRVDGLLKTEPAIVDRPEARRLDRLSSGIRLEDVTFGYSANEPVLRGLSLDIPGGASVALVGPSGCGKSTVLNLIMRFYDPQRGSVLFDGVDLRDATVSSVRSQMGIVFQDNFLFNVSLRENIRLGNPEATDQQVEAAARAAEIHDVIAGLPDGYNTVVGERGGRLSGGQRQRVAIARAIIRNPSILLLDEATSALDPRTESAINETLHRIARGRTTISVTHRLSSVVDADRIFVLEAGRLVETGTHPELLRRGGLYATLWKEQGGVLPTREDRALGVEAGRLQHIPLFSRVPADLLARVAGRLYAERYAPGDIVVQEGEQGDRMYLIERGQADVLTANPVGRPAPLAVLRDGDYFGEMAVLYDVPRTATVRARTPLQLYSLSKSDFQDLLRAVPALSSEIQRTVAHRTRSLTTQ